MSDEMNMESAGADRRPFKARNKFFKKKVCKFCVKKAEMDYKDADSLRRLVSEKGKILPRRITGTCAKHQRALAKEVKRARTIAVLPFAGK